MSILQLKKASLIGLTENKQHTLDSLQQLGLMHIISLKNPPHALYLLKKKPRR